MTFNGGKKITNAHRRVRHTCTEFGVWMLHILALTLHRFTGSTCFVVCNVSNGNSFFSTFSVLDNLFALFKVRWTISEFSQTPKIVTADRMDSINAVNSRLCCDGNAPLHEFASSKTKHRLACLTRLDSAAVVFVCESSVCVHKIVHEKSKKANEKKWVSTVKTSVCAMHMCVQSEHIEPSVYERLTEEEVNEEEKFIY